MRWEYGLGLLVLAGSHWIPGTTLVSEAGLWFGGLVLGAGMLRDFWELSRGGEQGGPSQVAMCVESVVGVAAVMLGLVLVLLSFARLLPPWLELPVPLAPLAGVSLLFAGWVHDLVWVKHKGGWELRRDPHHGSFVVHFFRGRADVCLLGADGEAETEAG
ncbi:MAG: hypothetical protein KF760_30405 [Candidatus Eremiobacteraeota bacterium]|nr:hypothetical protein [Candidatus Eremiobacteraeota bacterium]MCW5868107.1 hypothetical protein [Candidatus Eremiobacteraeota bacterium]